MWTCLRRFRRKQGETVFKNVDELADAVYDMIIEIAEGKKVTGINGEFNNNNVDSMSFCACSVFHDCTEIFCQSSTVKSLVTPPPWLDGHTSTPFSKYGCRMSHAPLKKYLAL